MGMLGPMFPYYGAKWRMTKTYSPPAHDVLIEPFAGSACYALSNYTRNVHLYDINPVIVGVWDFLIRSSHSDIMALPPTVPETVDNLHVCQEAKWLIGFWINAASAGPRNIPTSWARNGTPQSSGPTNSWFNPVMRARVARQSSMIKHWAVHLRSYDAIEMQPATWFVDPPYQEAGKHYTFSDIDYAHLGTWCQGLPGHVIVCENEGAGWLPFKPHGTTSSARPGMVSKEAVWERGAAQETFGFADTLAT